MVGGPYGAVKEQSSGLYAQTMAERGYITIAHDPSYVGESGGQPHGIASSEALVEDFSAGVDYLGRLSFVDRERIGVLGVCGSGGFGLAAAEIDPRIKAVATVSMYDIGQAQRQGLATTLDAAALRKTLDDVAAQRWAEVDGAERAMVIGTPQVLTASSTAIDREFYDYYRTPRGQHPRATTAFSRTSTAPMTLFWSYQHLDWISPRPVLFITGDQAHSRIFSEHAYGRASEPKELFIVPGAGHVDLYDRVKLIPWDKLQSFFGRIWLAARRHRRVCAEVSDGQLLRVRRVACRGICAGVAVSAGRPASRKREHDGQRTDHHDWRQGVRRHALGQPPQQQPSRRCCLCRSIMSELNGNEKLYRLPTSLPAQPSRPASIQNGDLMLYGENTVVLFYKSFATTYSYTRIGRIDDPAGLARAVGDGSVTVTFAVRQAK